MANNWDEVKLGDISSDVSYGYTESATNEEVGPKFLRITDIQNGVVDWNTVPYCPIDDSKLKKYLLHTGDIVVARTGNSTGENYIFTGEQDTVYASYLIRFRLKEDVANPFFVWYSMRSPQWWAFIQGAKTGSAQAGANAKVLSSYSFKLPPMPEQKAIAHILGTLDDKIELNRQMNETLEAMAQALFKSWFVDFDPVIDNALLAGKAIPEPLKERAEMRQAQLDSGKSKTNSEINDLFPSEFEFIEDLGWIPKGWDVDSIDNMIEINPRLTLKKGTLASHADMKALPESGFNIDGVIEKEYSGGTKFQNRDVLFARITPCLENGKTGLVDFLEPGEVGFGSTEFIVLREKDNITMEFVACLARNNKFRLHAIQSMVGSSGRQRVQNSCFSDFYMALPKSSNKVLELFHEMTSVNFEKISIQAKESRTLAKLRDTLLPKLMSGELRIPDAEKLVANI
ncbi:restriction endonuclease subunit S [Psychrobacter sp. FDAARGOS_221]|uniref:restriction endonuclease subunit S n=1 Tax=Psychrobacter sp. FDAARGOS_221 TaxID=1975705 RepID=UPI000BB56A75|nr:restriction endonuclease subunit S [Psychrobacter sp. FDAARGOS_221]PNK59665.1 restriction endonuclease subunit S [Psychrobacter sp. FDAARGOS_221]